MADSHDMVTLTKNQKFVFDVLSDTALPLSAYSILDQLRDVGFRAPLQVYRALDKLVELGKVHRLESMNAFVACQHPECDAHKTIAFTICNSCEQVQEINDEMITLQLKNIAKQSNFALQHSTIELRGQCADCATH